MYESYRSSANIYYDFSRNKYLELLLAYCSTVGSPASYWLFFAPAAAPSLKKNYNFRLKWGQIGRVGTKTGTIPKFHFASQHNCLLYPCILG